MTSTAIPQTPRTRTTVSDARAPHLSFLRLVRSEWLKLITLRSTWWSLAIVAVLGIGLGSLVALTLTTIPDGIDIGMSGAQAVLQVSTFATLLAVILGCLQVTGEYSTGMVRSTLTANPGRLGSLLAKAIVVGLFLFLSSVVIFTVGVLIAVPILGGGSLAIDLASFDDTWRPILASSFAMATIAVMGVGLGYLIRSGAGAIAAGVGIVFVLPLVWNFFMFAGESWKWLLDAARFLPTNAASTLMGFSNESVGMAELGATGAAIALTLWALIPLAAGATRLLTRDA